MQTARLVLLAGALLFSGEGFNHFDKLFEDIDERVNFRPLWRKHRRWFDNQINRWACDKEDSKESNKDFKATEFALQKCRRSLEKETRRSGEANKEAGHLKKLKQEKQRLENTVVAERKAKEKCEGKAKRWAKGEEGRGKAERYAERLERRVDELAKSDAKSEARRGKAERYAEQLERRVEELKDWQAQLRKELQDEKLLSAELRVRAEAAEARARQASLADGDHQCSSASSTAPAPPLLQPPRSWVGLCFSAILVVGLASLVWHRRAKQSKTEGAGMTARTQLAGEMQAAHVTLDDNAEVLDRAAHDADASVPAAFIEGEVAGEASDLGEPQVPGSAPSSTPSAGPGPSSAEKRMTFGKHMGKTYNDVWHSEPDYCEWVMRMDSPTSQPAFREFALYLEARKANAQGTDREVASEEMAEVDHPMREQEPAAAAGEDFEAHRMEDGAEPPPVSSASSAASSDGSDDWEKVMDLGGESLEHSPPGSTGPC